MGLFYFHGDVHQFLISSANLKEALDAFAQCLTDLYGDTLRAWELSSESMVKVYWMEEGERQSNHDIFQIKLLPENTAVCFAGNDAEAPRFFLPGELRRETTKRRRAPVPLKLING